MNRKSLMLVGVLPLMFACAQGTDPTTLLGDPTATPQLALPVINSPGITFTQFGATVDGFVFTVTAGQSVSAPAGGVVTSVDTGLDSGFLAITVVHNAHFATKVRKMLQTTSIRVGDTVVAGQTIGTVPGSNGITAPIQMTVYLDGSPVCPYSYLSQDARTLLNTIIGTTHGVWYPPCIAL